MINQCYRKMILNEVIIYSKNITRYFYDMNIRITYDEHCIKLLSLIKLPKKFYPHKTKWNENHSNI